MTETDFLRSIDCRFPYGDNVAARALVVQSLEISPNAVFMVVHELARPGYSVNPSVARRLELLSEIRGSFKHPIAGPVLTLAERIILGEEASVEEAIAVMEQIRHFPNEYSALAIAYMSCDDRENLADRLYNNIVNRWREGT